MQMQCDEGTEWLLELLTDVQLQQYFVRIRDDLNVTRLSHFDYVKNEDLEKIGMGRPGDVLTFTPVSQTGGALWTLVDMCLCRLRSEEAVGGGEEEKSSL